MNKLDRALIELRVVRRRLDALEAARPPRRKRESAPKPDSVIVIGRLKLWSRLTLLYLEIKHARLTKLKFVVKFHLGDPSDFGRFLSSAGRGIAEGSAPALRYYAALRAFLAELEALRDAHRHLPHGIPADSPSFSARQQ